MNASPEGLTVLAIIGHASPVVQIIMALLLAASVVSWTMIFRKWFALKAAQQEADRFEERFWSGGNLSQMYTELSQRHPELSGMEAIFFDGFREFGRLSKQGVVESKELLDGVQRSMRVALTRESDYLETYLAFLATVGSTSPYVGLFGTVWGIMNAFGALGNVAQVTISHVAPGISEALIATAMGLFAAIPAVIAYNRYSHQVERLVTRYEIFVEEFASLLQRQTLKARA